MWEKEFKKDILILQPPSKVFDGACHKHVLKIVLKFLNPRIMPFKSYFACWPTFGNLKVAHNKVLPLQETDFANFS